LRQLALTDDACRGLVDHLRRAIDADRFPLSPRLRTLRAILAELDPLPAPKPPGA
jgi:hypothetical protein